MKSFVTVVTICLLAASAGAATVFDDQFTGTAADPDAAKWHPNEDSAAFDNYLDTTYSADGALHSECIGGGGDNGGFLFFSGPLGKVGIDRIPGGPTIWSWETLFLSSQPDVTGDPAFPGASNNSFFDVLFSPYAPPAIWDDAHKSGHAAYTNLMGVRVGLYDGTVTIMEVDNGTQYLTSDSSGNDGRLPGVWTLTFPADLTTDQVKVEVDQGSGPVVVTSAWAHGNNVGATEQYPMFRHYNQTGWNPYYLPADTLAVVDYISGVSVPEPATLLVLAAGGLLIRRKK